MTLEQKINRLTEVTCKGFEILIPGYESLHARIDKNHENLVTLTKLVYADLSYQGDVLVKQGEVLTKLEEGQEAIKKDVTSILIQLTDLSKDVRAMRG